MFNEPVFGGIGSRALAPSWMKKNDSYAVPKWQDVNGNKYFSKTLQYGV